jgi:hypothetical protein
LPRIQQSTELKHNIALTRTSRYPPHSSTICSSSLLLCPLAHILPPLSTRKDPREYSRSARLPSHTLTGGKLLAEPLINRMTISCAPSGLPPYLPPLPPYLLSPPVPFPPPLSLSSLALSLSSLSLSSLALSLSLSHPLS